MRKATLRSIVIMITVVVGCSRSPNPTSPKQEVELTRTAEPPISSVSGGRHSSGSPAESTLSQRLAARLPAATRQRILAMLEDRSYGVVGVRFVNDPQSQALADSILTLRASRAARLPIHVTRTAVDSTACVTATDIPDSLPKLSPEQKRRFGKSLLQQVKTHQACVGMSKEALIASWGLPPTMRVQHQGADRYDVWEYPSHIVYLKNSIVTGVR